MSATPSPLDTALIVFVVAVAIIDWRSHRIPNLLCAASATIGLISQMSLHGAAGLLAALGGVTIGLIAFLPFYVMRAFGAGDVKAMATVGIFLGAKVTLFAVGMTLIAGAVLGVLVMLCQKAPANATLHRLIGLLAAPAAAIRASRHNTTTESPQRFPYGVAIACGSTAALLIVTH